jgi:hypothetical protein
MPTKMSTLKLPDGPQTHPWQQTLQWLANPLGYMEACAGLVLATENFWSLRNSVLPKVAETV